MKKFYLLPCLLVFSFSVNAAIKTWIGPAANSVWGYANNWSPAGFPGPSDDIVIDGASVTLDVNAMVKSVRLSNNAQLSIMYGVSLTIPVQSPGRPAFDLYAGTQLSVSGTLNIGNNTAASIVTGINVDNAVVTISYDGKIAIDRCVTGIYLGHGSTLSNLSILEIGQQGTLTGQGVSLNSTSTLQNSSYGTVRIDNVQGPAIIAADGPAVAINNSGTINIGGTGNITGPAISVTNAGINNSGSIYFDGTTNGIEMSRGTLTTNNNSGIYAGTITAIAGSAIVAERSQITNGGFMIFKNTTVDGLQLTSGSFTNNSQLRIGHYPQAGGGIGSGNCGGIGIHAKEGALINNNSYIDFGIISGNAVQLESAASFTNSAIINGSDPWTFTGFTTAISGSMMVLDAATFINAASGNYRAYNSTSSKPVGGFILKRDSRAENRGIVDMIGPDVAVSLEAGSEFDNYNSLQAYSYFDRCLYVAGGSRFENFAGGTIHFGGLQHNISSSVIYVTDISSTLVNSGNILVNDGNGSSHGIEIVQEGSVQNMNNGVFDLSNIQGSALKISGRGSLQNNDNGKVNLSGIKGYGIEIYSLGSLQNKNAGAIDLLNIGENGIEITNGQMINNGTITLNKIVKIPLHLSGGNTSTNSGNLKLGNDATSAVYSRGAMLIEGTGTVLKNDAAGQITVDHVATGYNGILVTTAASLQNSGRISWGTPQLAFAGVVALRILSGGIFDNNASTSILEFVNCTENAIVSDITSSGSGSTLGFNGGTVKFGNVTLRGIYVDDAGVVLTNKGTFETMPGGSMTLIVGINNAPTGVLKNIDGSVILGYGFSNSGTVTNGGSLSNLAAFTNASGGFVINNGTWRAGGIATFTNNLNAVFKGSGTFQGSVFNNAGTVAPGNSPGCINFSNGILNQSSSTLDIEINGKTTSCTQFDRLNVTGTATINGALRVTFGGDYTGALGDQVTILKSTSLSGTFSSTNLPPNWGVLYNQPATGDVTLTYMSILPLRLLDFSVQKTGEKAIASWTTTDEVNTHHFELERSNGNQFEKIATVVAINTTGDHLYQATDPLPLTGRNNYRLKMIDIDGKYTYSPVVSVSLDKPQKIIAAIYPNPAKDILNIAVTETMNDLLVQVISEDGKILLTNLLPARGVHKLNLSLLAAGIYFIKTNHGEIYKLIKQ